MMVVEDPFGPALPEIHDVIVNMLEKCWGLALISFLSGQAQKDLSDLQNRIAGCCCPEAADPLRDARHYIEFHEPEQFHITLMVLRENLADGPVVAGELVKAGHHISELPEIVGSLAARARPVTVRLDRVFFSGNEVIFGLLGQCTDADSADAKKQLALNMYETLRKTFNINPRPYEIDPDKLDHVHSSLGIIKRPPPEGYPDFVRRVKNMEFEPIPATLAEISLVHTKRAWSLAFPQQGLLRFPLGTRTAISKNESAEQLRLA